MKILVQNLMYKYSSWVTYTRRQLSKPYSGWWWLLPCPSCTDVISKSQKGQIHAPSLDHELFPYSQKILFMSFFQKNMTFQFFENFPVEYGCPFIWRNLNLDCEQRLRIFMAGRISPMNKQMFNQHFDWRESCKFWMNCLD